MSADGREQFLISVYGVMWDNINRHILVVWQSVGVLAGAFAAFMLADKEVLPLDYGVALLVLVCAWQVAHVMDASWWFNRNLLIATNIERQFLLRSDLHEIHYYFERHRKPTMLDHQRIQLAFGLLTTLIVLLYHFIERLYPGLGSSIENLELLRGLPYIAAVVCAALLVWLNRHERSRFQRLSAKSPGKDIDLDSELREEPDH